MVFYQTYEWNQGVVWSIYVKVLRNSNIAWITHSGPRPFKAEGLESRSVSSWAFRIYCPQSYIGVVPDQSTERSSTLFQNSSSESMTISLRTSKSLSDSFKILTSWLDANPVIVDALVSEANKDVIEALSHMYMCFLHTMSSGLPKKADQHLRRISWRNRSALESTPAGFIDWD